LHNDSWCFDISRTIAPAFQAHLRVQPSPLGAPWPGLFSIYRSTTEQYRPTLQQHCNISQSSIRKKTARTLWGDKLLK